MKKIALNYIYLGRKHTGGKDQVGINLLKGFHELNATGSMLIICYDYLEKTIRKIAPDAQVITIRAGKQRSEFSRMLHECFVGTFIIPKIIKENNIEVVLHVNCNNGLRKMPVTSIVIPHDIKAISHRVLANVKIPLYKYVLYKIMYAVDFRHADNIIAISNFDKKEICKYYNKYNKKVIRIYNPVIEEGRKWSGNLEKYICAINLQFQHKNIITLIKAFERIKSKLDYKLVLIGNVPERVEYLIEYVKEHKLEERVIFTGFLEEEQIDELLANCSLYVNPTLFEGFGMTAVEALIKGVPTLISDASANVEVTKGLCEYYKPAEDDRELAKRIVECLKKEYDKDELIKKGQILASEYHYLNISRQYLELLKK